MFDWWSFVQDSNPLPQGQMHDILHLNYCLKNIYVQMGQPTRIPYIYTRQKKPLTGSKYEAKKKTRGHSWIKKKKPPLPNGATAYPLHSLLLASFSTAVVMSKAGSATPCTCCICMAKKPNAKLLSRRYRRQ
jgi:hypothetical protein